MSKNVNQGTNNSQFTIYDRVSRQRILVSEEYYTAHTRDIDTHRHRQQDRGFCKCPRYEWRYCNTDCLTCRYYTAGGDTWLSLDAPGGENNDGETVSMLNAIVQSPDIAEAVVNKARLRELLADLEAIMPEAIAYGHNRQNGDNKDAAAKKTGLKRSTFNSRLAKVKVIFW